MVEYKTRYAIYIKIDMLSFKNKDYFRKKNIYSCKDTGFHWK